MYHIAALTQKSQEFTDYIVMKELRCKTFPATNSLFVTFQILWPLDTMNCGVLRPQIASLWSMVTRLSVLDLVKIGRGYWLYLHERIHMQYVSRHKLSLCDLSNIVTFEHNELWCTPTTNSLSVKYGDLQLWIFCDILHFLASMKYNILLNVTEFRKIVTLWPFKYCELWTQWTVVSSDHK